MAKGMSKTVCRIHDATPAVQARKKAYSVSDVGFMNSAASNAVK